MLREGTFSWLELRLWALLAGRKELAAAAEVRLR